MDTVTGILNVCPGSTDMVSTGKLRQFSDEAESSVFNQTVLKTAKCTVSRDELKLVKKAYGDTWISSLSDQGCQVLCIHRKIENIKRSKERRNFKLGEH